MRRCFPSTSLTGSKTGACALRRVFSLSSSLTTGPAFRFKWKCRVAGRPASRLRRSWSDDISRTNTLSAVTVINQLNEVRRTMWHTDCLTAMMYTWSYIPYCCPHLYLDYPRLLQNNKRNTSLTSFNV